jgi:hypothetical protein
MTDDALRLHTDDQGIVWCGQNGVRAFCSGLPPAEFVRRQVFRDARQVRLLGVPENSALVLKSHEEVKRSNKKDRRRVFLGSPKVCHREAFRRDPVFVLQQMWQSDQTAKLPGSWHLLNEKDYNTFLMVHALRSQGGQIGTLAENAVRYHPIWQAITFLPEFHVESAIKLACEIVDPRWYNDSRRPGRVQALLMHLGIEPANIQAFAGIIPPEATPGCRNWKRAELVLKAWNGLDYGRQMDLDEPRNFLWRIYRDNGGGAKGLLKASKAFVQFIRLVWLQELAASPKREVFCPEIYFKHDCELQAWRKHRERRSQS